VLRVYITAHLRIADKIIQIAFQCFLMLHKADEAVLVNRKGGKGGLQQPDLLLCLCILGFKGFLVSKEKAQVPGQLCIYFITFHV